MTHESKHRPETGLQDRGPSPESAGTGDGHQILRFGTDRAVSPIVATIILIALVVVMGGVVASMVFGFGGHQQQTPHAKITFQYSKGASSAASGSTGVVHVRDTGGSKLSSSNTLHLKIKDTTQGWSVKWGRPVKAGSTKAIGTNHKIQGGDHLEVVWTGPNGKNTATLAHFNVPK